MSEILPPPGPPEPPEPVPEVLRPGPPGAPASEDVPIPGVQGQASFFKRAKSVRPGILALVIPHLGFEIELTAAEAALVLGTSTNSFRNYVDRYQLLRTYRRIGHHPRRHMFVPLSTIRTVRSLMDRQSGKRSRGSLPPRVRPVPPGQTPPDAPLP